jgi:hypothetical protein
MAPGESACLTCLRQPVGRGVFDRAAGNPANDLAGEVRKAIARL